jgi:hypothetical protein
MVCLDSPCRETPKNVLKKIGKTDSEIFVYFFGKSFRHGQLEPLTTLSIRINLHCTETSKSAASANQRKCAPQ